MSTKGKIDAFLQATLALLLLMVGINKFVPFMTSPEMPEEAGGFMQALAETGYMMPLVGLTEIVVGLLLLLRLWSALALVLLAPLSVNLILFHLVLAPGSIVMALAVAALNLYLLYVYRDRYTPMLRPK